jgi:hypothetical protein
MRRMSRAMRALGLALLVGVALAMAGCGGSQIAAASKLPGLDAACGVGNARVRPAQINFCGDMKWPTWNAIRAAGHGTADINDCNPDCARGHVHGLTVNVRISHPKGCRNRTRTRVFTQLSVVRFNGRKPPSGAYHYVFGCA